MQITSKQVKFVREFDSSNGGNRSMIPISDFLKVPLEIPDPEDTKIFRCYDENKKLLGEIRPKKGDRLYDIKFTEQKSPKPVTLKESKSCMPYKYAQMTPITEPMSYEERLEMHAGAILAIDNIEDATKFAKIFLSLIDKAKHEDLDKIEKEMQKDLDDGKFAR